VANRMRSGRHIERRKSQEIGTPPQELLLPGIKRMLSVVPASPAIPF